MALRWPPATCVCSQMFAFSGCVANGPSTLEIFQGPWCLDDWASQKLTPESDCLVAPGCAGRSMATFMMARCQLPETFASSQTHALSGCVRNPPKSTPTYFSTCLRSSSPVRTSPRFVGQCWWACMVNSIFCKHNMLF